MAGPPAINGEFILLGSESLDRDEIEVASADDFNSLLAQAQKLAKGGRFCELQICRFDYDAEDYEHTMWEWPD